MASEVVHCVRADKGHSFHTSWIPAFLVLYTLQLSFNCPLRQKIQFQTRSKILINLLDHHTSHHSLTFSHLLISKPNYPKAHCTMSEPECGCPPPSKRTNQTREHCKQIALEKQLSAQEIAGRDSTQTHAALGEIFWKTMATSKKVEEIREASRRAHDLQWDFMLIERHFRQNLRLAWQDFDHHYPGTPPRYMGAREY